MARVLAVQQRKQLLEIFKQFDMDSDESLTYLELAALLRSIGLNLSGDQIYTLFNKMDSDGNGMVKFEAFVDAMTIDVKTEEIVIDERQLLEAFRSFDREGNGFITPTQLAISMAKMGYPLTYHELVALFKKADRDEDGVISFKEFSTIMAKSVADIFGMQVS
ncbi:probable calcium-binding protein CML15 [Tanacetum coccineum]|uniref:Probable calcium-binding protein CML15 n=1 Tax=Tanacetum coccineum TaxID=301880 RepID=A0ABQ5AL31_9ASTR